MSKGNIHSRLDHIEARMPKPESRDPEAAEKARAKVREFLDRYAEHKATGTLTQQDAADMQALRRGLERRAKGGGY